MKYGKIEKMNEVRKMMTTIVSLLDKIFEEKNMPVERQEIDGDLALYILNYQLKPNHLLRMEMICPKDLTRADVQMTYRYVSMLPRYEKRHDVLEIINDFNETDSGYYTFYLANDGEIYARTLIRSGLDVEGIFEIMYQGPFIISHILPKLEQIIGEFSNV